MWWDILMIVFRVGVFGGLLTLQGLKASEMSDAE